MTPPVQLRAVGKRRGGGDGVTAPGVVTVDFPALRVTLAERFVRRDGTAPR